MYGIFFILLLPAGALLADENGRVYKLGIVPQYSPLFIYRHWRPLVTRLQQELGVRIEIETYKDFKQFNKALQQGGPDFTYLSPYHLVTARRSQPYVPLLRDASKQLVGIIVVPRDSTVKTVEELQGQKLVFPSPNAFAASLYLRAYLREKLGMDFTSEYAGSHGNVYRKVARKLVVAGGGVNSSLASQPALLQESLRVLFEIPGVAAHPVAAHTRVPKDLRDRFVSSFMKMRNDTRGRKMLDAVQISMPFHAEYKRDYIFLESLKLEKYRSGDSQ